MIFIITCQPAFSEIQTYSIPAEISKGNSFIYPSKEYKVELIQDQTYQPFVYTMSAMHTTNVSKTTGWVNFSFSGKVKVRVTKMQGDNITFCQVLPKNKNIQVEIKENRVEFELSETGHYSVEFQKGIVIDHPLLLFANPLETNIPLKNDPNTIYFEDGLHDIGDKYLIPSHKKVYVSGGAYIKGQFYAENGENISVSGRGILSGENYPARTANHMLVFKNVNQVTIEGITIIHAPRYMISVSGQHTHIDNVKMLGWWFSTDGISAGENSIIENCFFKVNDDAIKLYSSHTIAKNNVIWQMENGAPFMISWNGTKDFGHCQVINNDIIRVEHTWDNENLAVICAVHGGKAHISDFLFENLRIDNANWRVFHVITKPNRWGKWDPEKGSIADMHFKNISYSGTQKIKSLIMGHDERHPVSNFTFENITFGGKSVRSLAEILIVDKETTHQIHLKP
ncbi:MAG: glycosyl hydrolase family 28 protein [Spirosomataceae bacterium]